MQMQCLSPLGQMSYSQINPNCQEKRMIVSLTTSPVQEEWMWLIKYTILKKKNPVSLTPTLKKIKVAYKQIKDPVKQEDYFKPLEMQLVCIYFFSFV